MDKVRIDLQDVSIHFPLSYQKIKETRDVVFQWWKRFFTRSYQKEVFIALDKVNLTIRDKEIVGIIGPNGSGKSTLLRTMSGIYSPDTGIVRTNGRLSVLLSLGTGFNTTLNGLDNIRLNGLMMGMTLAEIEALIPKIIEFADIGDHIYAPMKYYSSGMISRVSFSILMALEPEIILIDEVFSVGDLSFQQKSTNVLENLLRQASAQVIVTHSLGMVLDHCSRAVYVSGGKILADGPPQEVVRQYEKDALGSVSEEIKTPERLAS